MNHLVAVGRIATSPFKGFRKRAFLCCVGAFAFLKPALADTTATVIEPANLGGVPPSYIYAVDNAGQIAGNAQIAGGSDRHAFIQNGATATDLGTLGAGNSYPYAINSSGTVVGWSDFEAGNWHSHGFVYRNGSMVDVGTLGGLDSNAKAINDLGQIAGDSSTAAGDNHAFLFSNGVMRDLGTLGGTVSYTKTINSRGDVVGYSSLAKGGYHAFLYSGGVMRDLGTLGGSSSEAYDLNDNGAVTGYGRVAGDSSYHAFYYSYGVSVDLGTLGGNLSEGYALNDAGQVVGWSYNSANIQRAFLATSGNPMIDLGTLGGSWSEAKDINNSGQIVGQAETAITVTVPPSPTNDSPYGYTYKVKHAFLYHQGRMIDLNDLLAPGSGWELFSASSINDAGYIICDAKRAGDTQNSTVVVRLVSTNAAPVANDDSASVSQDSVGGVFVLFNDSDPDNDPLKISAFTQGAHGRTQISTWAVGIEYRPDAGYKGTDSFTYTISDNHGHTATATVTVTVTSNNRAPVASPQDVVTDEDTAKVLVLSATDSDGDALSYSVVAPPSHGTLGGTAPNLTYTPNLNYNGSDSFTFKASDGTLSSSAATVNISVTAVNDAPVSSTQSVTLDEDTGINVTLAATDAEGDALTFSVLSQPTGGTLSGIAPNLSYAPNANFNGSDLFTFKANDGKADSNIATVSISVNSVNDLPVADAQSVQTDEDTAIAVTLTGSDVEGSPLTYAVVSPPAKGTLSGTTPNLTYTPNADATGTDSFSFKANDGASDSAAATVSISILAINDAPIANDQSVSLTEDIGTNITLTASDVDSTYRSYSIVSNPSHGQLLTVAGSPGVSYKPDANYKGADSFTFKASDGKLDSNTATVRLTIASVNDVPVASSQTLSTREDTPLSLTLAASDVDNDALTFAVTVQPAHGTLSGTIPNLIYTPEANYKGADKFSFTANDGTAISGAALVVINVLSVNDAPVADNQSVTTNRDTAKSITLSASDVDGDALTFGLATLPTNGTVSGTGANVVYTPNSNFTGSDSFQFIASDGVGGRSTGTVSINVLATNRAPVSSTQSVTTNEDTAKSITLSASDADGDALTYSVVTPPARGTLSGSGTNRVYTPNANFNGSDSFTFKANDGKVDGNIATVSITVAPVNDAPVATPDVASTPKNIAKTIAVTANDSDVDGDALVVSSVTQGKSGSVSFAGGSVTYTPKRNFIGSDTFSYTISDGKGGTATATVAVTVTK